MAIHDLVEVRRVGDLGRLQGLSPGPAARAAGSGPVAVGDADLVILTDDDLSKALTTVDEIRGMNSQCKIVCRVFHDDAADMLSSAPFKCDVISTSRYAVDQLRVQGAFKSVGLVGKPAKKTGPVKKDEVTPPPSPEGEEEPLQLVHT